MTPRKKRKKPHLVDELAARILHLSQLHKVDRPDEVVIWAQLLIGAVLKQKVTQSLQRLRDKDSRLVCLVELLPDIPNMNMRAEGSRKDVQMENGKKPQALNMLQMHSKHTSL